jgi:hypothetical protein
MAAKIKSLARKDYRKMVIARLSKPGRMITFEKIAEQE